MKFFTHIEGGKFRSRKLRDLLASLEGQDVEVEVLPARRYNGPGLHKYYRGSLVPTFGQHLRETGHNFTDWDAHRILADRFLKTATYDPASDNYNLFTESTAKISLDDFGRFILNVEVWLIEYWQLQLPEK